MGTRFAAIVYAPDPGTAHTAARAALDEVARLDAVLSDYRPDSELMQLVAAQASGARGPVRVSPDLLRVLRIAREVSEETDGAFDVTIGELSRRWRRILRQKEIRPGWIEEIRRIQASGAGWRAIRIDEPKSTVEFAAPGIRLDLGGIGKGYALDRAVEVARRRGARSVLIDGGGDIAVSGPPPGGDAWRIAVEPPFPSLGGEPVRLRIPSGAVATSGDLHRYAVIEGVRYSHILDPRSGMALTQPIQVTVFADCGARADALASGLCVLGPGRGRELVERLTGVEARFCTIEGGEVAIVESSGFSRLLAPVD